MGYCRIMEVIGGHCAATAVFVNAHHSIGLRALVLFGTPEQKARWLPSLTSARKLAAFALTEEQAGSDASNVQTTATPSADGHTYILNGSKRYITNGAIADVLTVMARTPDPHGGKSKVTAFLVTPDMPGFEVVEARMPKCGIRGTATARLAFHDMPVPATNILGQLGKGLRMALTVLDFGRTTFGASCTGAAKVMLAAATKHAANRRQFGRPLADLELIKKKIAYLAATAYAMEATTYQTAALIDGGAEDYMLETAILKVFTTEALWQGAYETLQVFGGQGYFSNELPTSRMMRDADQHDRRRSKRGAQGFHRARRHARHRRRAQEHPGRFQEARHASADLLELQLDAHLGQLQYGRRRFRWPRPCFSRSPRTWRAGYTALAGRSSGCSSDTAKRSWIGNTTRSGSPTPRSRSLTSACTLSRWDHSLVQGTATSPDETRGRRTLHADGVSPIR